jgi:hypothetical protein
MIVSDFVKYFTAMLIKTEILCHNLYVTVIYLAKMYV